MNSGDQHGEIDVVIIGGALSGSATALLLHRRNPKLRILILEKSGSFDRRVGESTVEVSAYFLGRVLGLTDHLNQNHIVKQGMRFWFANEETQSIADCSETGPGYNVRFPGYQIDRAVLDEEVLSMAGAAGVRIERPVRVRDVKIVDGGEQTVHWEREDGTRETTAARWLVDASGFAAIVARKNHWVKNNVAHPIASCWSRWRGVKSWDSRDLRERFPEWADRTKAIRFTATNHIMGRGWWAWWIPLKGGDVSIGVVYDQRLVELPAGKNLGERLGAFLRNHPAARELLANAYPIEGDVHFRRDCSYHSSTIAGNGVALVGDAAAFIDPFYSPGMDWISFTASATASLIDQCMRGRPAAERVEAHNQRFGLCYDRWFHSIYRDKYFYMGDHELMTLAFRLDLGLYYLGVVSQPFRFGETALEIPAFTRPGGGAAARLIRVYHRRLASIGRSRMERGTWGRKNSGRSYSFTSYELNWRLPLRIIGALGAWVGLEIREGWRTWFHRPAVPEPAGKPKEMSSPAPATAPW